MNLNRASGIAGMSSVIVALVLGANVTALAQNTPTQTSPPQATKSEPMALETTQAQTQTTRTETTSTTSTPGTDEGFWFWPEPAPLTGPIVTDRPGFSDSALLVPRGHVQIESGYSFTYDNEDHIRVYNSTAPQIALRTGLTNWLELRVQWAGYSWSEVHDDNFKTPAGRHISHDEHPQSGYDMNLGFKLPIIKQEDKCRPTISVIPSLYVPTGYGNTTFGNVVPELKFPWNYDINPCWSIYGSVLGRVPDGPDGQWYQTGVTLATSYSITDWVSVYLEYFGLYHAQRNEDCAHLLSAGPVFHITKNFSVDTRASVGLNEEAPDFQASIGFGIRF